MARALPILAAAAVLLVCAGGPASAADELAWGLGPFEMVRYDLVAGPIERDPGAQSVYGQEPDRARLVRGDDFERGRRHRGQVSTIADLVWLYALSLPEGAGAGKRGTAPINEKHARAALVAKGTDEVALENGLWKLKATLAVATEPPPPANGWGIAAGTTLVVSRTFDPALRRVTEASYALEARQVMNGKASAWKISGRIACAGAVDFTSRAFLVSVEEAIGRGAAKLRKELADYISRSRQFAARGQLTYVLGHAALATFALLRSGVGPEELKDAFAFMEGCPWTEVYSVSLYLMCLEARHVRREAVPPEAGGHTVSRFAKEPVPDADRALMSKAAEWLIRSRTKGAWTYNPPKGGVIGDRSNSQFAALALHVAATSGVKLDPQVFADVADEIVGAQEPGGPSRSLRGCTFTAAAPRGLLPGGAGGGGRTAAREAPMNANERGWAYAMAMRCPPGQAYGSMTAAGVSSAVIAREALRRAGRLDPERDEKTRRAILDGIAWLAGHFTPSRNPEHAGFELYWLYSLEKAMELAGVESLAGHDWWLEGAAQLLSVQKDDGAFGAAQISDTALALLFLNRATLPTRVVVEARPAVSSGKDDPAAWDLVKVDGTGFVHLAQVLDALSAAAPDEAKDVARIAEKAFDELPLEERPRLVPRLASLARADATPAARTFAKKALKAATGGIDDEAKALLFHERWQAAVKAGELYDYAAIPSLAKTVGARDATAPLRRAALVSLARLRAVEALPGLLDELASGDAAWRREVFTAVVSIAGGERRPFDPAASAAERARQLEGWGAWWTEARGEATAAEGARRQGEKARQ